MKKLIKENFDSENLFEKFNLLTESEINRITLGIDWTNKYLPDSVVIGGTSIIYYLHSGRDLTPDLDYLVSKIEYTKFMLDKDKIRYSTINSGTNSNLGISVENFNTDYLDSNIGNTTLNKLILNNYNEGLINGRKCKIVVPELLTIMKFEISRNKDQDDAFALLASGKLNKSKYLNFLFQLKDTLSEYESLISYAEMIK
jgi:predicted nucleotidyltransferase